MLDLSHIPDSQQDMKIFYAISGSNSWQTWTKPRKCQWVWIMAIGGASSGIAGSNINNSSGQAGAAGAVTRGLFNASFLPDTLYVQVGPGGAGTTSISVANPGTRSFIALQPSTTSTNVVLTSGAVAATATTAGGLITETPATTTNMAFATLGTFLSIQTLSQGNVDTTPLISTLVTNGGYGGGKTNTPSVVPGKSILSSSISPLIRGGIGSLTTDGDSGGDGITSWKPFFSTGGAGGGASTVGFGGKGGDGGIGSGGGGGGAGTLGGGSGGKGGDGLVVIVAF